MTKFYTVLFALVMGFSANAQSPNVSPNCRDLNANVDSLGNATIAFSDFVANYTAVSADVTITRSFGGIVHGPTPLSGNASIVLPVCSYLGESLKINVSSQAGSCWSNLTFKQGNGPTIVGRAKDVYCFDPLIEPGQHIDDEPPLATIPCEASEAATFVADWVTPYACGGPFDPLNDTLKVILREYEAFDKAGNRGFAFDTITVFRLPAIEPTVNIYCAEKDTTYCGQGNAGPFMVYPERCDPATFGSDQDGDGSLCDTIYFLVYDDSLGRYHLNPFLDDTKCGLLSHLEYWNFGSGGCEEQSKYTLELKQECVPPRVGTCLATGLAANAFTQLVPGYLVCTFWFIDLDTVPPVVDCKDDNLLLTTVYTGTHECAAHTYVVPTYVQDDWSGIKQVKATIEDVGTTIMAYNAENKCWEGHTQFKLPYKELPYRIVYEAYDSCHNIGYDTCYIRVKDNTRPVPVVDKGVTVSLSDKKVWVEAKTFDEGSWDNCGVNLLLARRADWYEACIDLCDDVDSCYITEHHDTLWQAQLEDDKHIDEVEAHYAKTLDWLCNDDVPCGDLIYNAWQYDLMKYATLECPDHPYDVDEDYFRGILDEAIQDPAFAYKWKNPSTLFIGTADNPGFSVNDAYYVRMNGSSTSVLSDFPIYGATTDFSQKRILFTSSAGSPSMPINGDQLYALPFGGVAPVLLGTVTTDGTTPLRIDGLAAIDGKLYGVVDNGLSDGFYSINLTTFIATLIASYDPMTIDISGIDADPVSKKIYGADDAQGSIVEIDPLTGSTSVLASFPIGQMDIDGVAVGAGKIFLVSDEPGFIYTYNLKTNSYDSPIISPFGQTDIFAGGAAYMPMLEDLVDEWSQIGGGWSDQVVFSCDDACGPVTVEVLVMDYWCNWGKAWTSVWVEDKTPITIAKDVIEEENITCKTYKDKRYAYPEEIHPVSLDYVVEQAKAGEQDAFDLLDEVFGGYSKAWKDPSGNYVDIDGAEIECDITFYDSVCQCTSYHDQVRVYDEHFGYIWKDSVITDCYYDQDTIDFQKGIAVVNCDQNVHCEQEVWCEFDHCGQGYIFRKFKIWQGCPDSFYLDHNVPDSLKHPVDTIYRHQRISVGNECHLSKYMFDVPGDEVVYSCDIEYDEGGNVVGDAGPENTGYATYKFDDDCRIVGIAHQDKVFKVVGGDAACYKIIRTWYFADWCYTGGIPLESEWILDTESEFFKGYCEQKIIVHDTLPPVCTITGPVESGGSIEVGACAFDLAVTVGAMDPCGLTRYNWELKNITDPDAVTIVDSGDGDLSDNEDNFDIESSDLAHGNYKLKVVTVDECNNEGYCDYLIDVISVKKPSPVCVTSLTATLTPWDSDQDGVVDSAHAVVWAGEFDSSSEPACQDTAIEFRIEFVTGDSTDATAAGDPDSLTVGCADAGTHLVRLWVVSLPSDTRDYCDVVLIVQNNSDICGSTIAGEPQPPSEVTGMVDDAKEMDRSMLTSDQGTKSVGVGGRPLGQIVGVEGYLLEQNTPNPFQAETNIGFVLPEAMRASVTVYDVTGRVIRAIEGDYVKGFNQVQFRTSDLGVSGILYYRLNAGTYSSTRKMVLIE